MSSASASSQPLSESQAERQLKQMMDFMKLEAKEKAEEIRVKAEHDYTMEKMMRVQQAKVKLREKFRSVEQQRLTEQRVLESRKASEQTGRILRAQEDMMKELHERVTKKINTWAKENASEYKDLLKELIKQGIHHVTLREHGEREVEIRCREKDLQAVEEVIPAALKEFHESKSDAAAAALAAAKKRGGRYDQYAALKVKAVINKNNFISDDNAGGVIVSTHQNRVVCDNTLSKRLGLAEDQLTPVLRYILFPSLRHENNTQTADRTHSSNSEVDLLA